jgi:hypothetical protein
MISVTTFYIHVYIDIYKYMIICTYTYIYVLYNIHIYAYVYIYNRLKETSEELDDVSENILHMYICIYI